MLNVAKLILKITPTTMTTVSQKTRIAKLLHLYTLDKSYSIISTLYNDYLIQYKSEFCLIIHSLLALVIISLDTKIKKLDQSLPQKHTSYLSTLKPYIKRYFFNFI